MLLDSLTFWNEIEIQNFKKNFCLFSWAMSYLPEEAMAPHSSTLAWRIPGTEEPGGLPSMGSHRVRHDWSDLAAASVLFTAYGI